MNVHALSPTKFREAISIVLKQPSKRWNCINPRRNRFFDQNVESIRQFMKEIEYAIKQPNYQEESCEKYPQVAKFLDNWSQLKEGLESCCVSLRSILYSQLQFINCTSSNDTQCPIHDAAFALKLRKSEKDIRSSICMDCSSPFLLVSQLKEHLAIAHTFSTTLQQTSTRQFAFIDQCREKFQAFIAHDMRAKYQLYTREQLMGIVRSNPYCLYIVADFKMKVLKIKHR